jgi:hypothetical protein
VLDRLALIVDLIRIFLQLLVHLRLANPLERDQCTQTKGEEYQQILKERFHSSTA